MKIKRAAEEAQKLKEEKRDQDLEAARARRREEMAAKKKLEIEESRRKIEEYNRNKTANDGPIAPEEIMRIEIEKEEKRKHFLEKAKQKKLVKREASLARNSSFRSVDNLDVKVEGPRSKKPTLAKSWRLEKGNGQK